MADLAEYIKRLSKLGGILQITAGDQQRIDEVVRELVALPTIDRASLTNLVTVRPDAVPILGLAAGLSQEQLKGTLRMELGTSSWTKLAKTGASELVRVLDEQFELVERLRRDLPRTFTYAEVLTERFGSRLRAGGAVQRGRTLEDAVEAIVDSLGLPKEMRTRFQGRAGATAPADMAIPGGGDQAEIVVGIKGFDSTGSKLTDAAREVQEMATVRKPKQFVFVVADGMGWLSRQSDLRRILALADDDSIAGVYTTETLDQFRVALEEAARMRGLLPPA